METETREKKGKQCLEILLFLFVFSDTQPCIVCLVFSKLHLCHFLAAVKREKLEG